MGPAQRPPLGLLDLARLGDHVALFVALGVGLGAIPMLADVRRPARVGLHAERPERQVDPLESVGLGHLAEITRPEHASRAHPLSIDRLRLVGGHREPEDEFGLLPVGLLRRVVDDVRGGAEGAGGRPALLLATDLGPAVLAAESKRGCRLGRLAVIRLVLRSRRRSGRTRRRVRQALSTANTACSEE